MEGTNLFSTMGPICRNILVRIAKIIVHSFLLAYISKLI